jgi:hypothetical protein
MNPKLIPILSRIIARDTVLSSFHADRLPQSALAYVRQHYLNDNFLWLTPEEQDLIEELPPFADDIADSFRAGTAPDDSVYHLFQDGSLWLRTNAYSSVWSDATDYAVEILLPRMELSRMDADLLRAIDMDDAVESVRADFYSSFAHTNCANVNLIASAPDLLAACEAVVNDCDAILNGDDMSGMSDQELFSAIRRTLTFAITKAKGGAL